MRRSSESFIDAMEMVEEGENQPKIAAKRIKLEEIKAEEEEGREDRISLLPDCLLAEILSRLPSIKGAIRTGILSHRWKHIWTWLPVLIFTDSDFKRPFYEFSPCVDKTLTQCRQLKLKRFELTFEFVTLSHINSWIRYAIGRNVEQLYLEFSVYEDRIEFEQFFLINSSFTDLKLNGYMLNPSRAIRWENLRSLWITDGKLDEDLIENILSGNPLLETLVLRCWQGVSRLDITAKSLKKLVISGYSVPDDGILEINAPNILSLRIKGVLGLGNILLLNVSSLVKADLDFLIWGWKRKRREEMLKRLILNLSHAKELKLGSVHSKVSSRLEAKGF